MMWQRTDRRQRPTMAELRARYPQLIAGAPALAGEPKPTPNYSDKPCTLSPAALATNPKDSK
jgi:hypothetical protein